MSPGPTVVSVFPKVHQALLPSTVTIVGTNFGLWGQVVCSIRSLSMQVIAVVKSDSQVECLFDHVPKGRHGFAIQDVSGSAAFVNFVVSLEFELTVVSRLHPDTLYS